MNNVTYIFSYVLKITWINPIHKNITAFRKVSQYPTRLIALGFAVCRNPLRFQNDHVPCWNDAKFISGTPSFTISVWKRFADIKYLLPSRSLDSVDNLSGRIEVEYVSAKTYHKYFETLFLKQDEPFDSLKYSIMVFVSTKLSDKDQAVRLGSSLRWIGRPWLFQGHGTRGDESDRWGEENRINATRCDTAERLVFAADAFYVITATCSITLGWCLWHLSQAVGWRRCRAVILKGMRRCYSAVVEKYQTMKRYRRRERPMANILKGARMLLRKLVDKYQTMRRYVRRQHTTRVENDIEMG